jgi:hypothetical protein
MPQITLPARLRIGRRAALIIGSAGLLVVAAVGAGAFLLLSGREELTYKTQAALRNALPTTASAELAKRGVTLASPLKCEDLPGWTKTKMRVSCHGTTSDKRPVEVIGTGEQQTKKNHYTILVGGRPVVENATCLGADCAKEEG